MRRTVKYVFSLRRKVFMDKSSRRTLCRKTVPKAWYGSSQCSISKTWTDTSDSALEIVWIHCIKHAQTGKRSHVVVSKCYLHSKMIGRPDAGEIRVVAIFKSKVGVCPAIRHKYQYNRQMSCYIHWWRCYDHRVVFHTASRQNINWIKLLPIYYEGNTVAV